MTAPFDPGTPITAGDLIEDDDGAPLPHELQTGGRIWVAVRDALHNAVTVNAANTETDAIVCALAPILWPLLPSNDHGAPTMPPDNLDADLTWLLDEFAALDGQVEAEFGPSADPDAGIRRATAIIERVRAMRGVVQAAREIEDELFMALLAAGQSAWPDRMPDLVSYARTLSIKLHGALAAAADAPQPEDGCRDCDDTGTVYLDRQGDECAEPDSVREVPCPHCSPTSGGPHWIVDSSGNHVAIPGPSPAVLPEARP